MNFRPPIARFEFSQSLQSLMAGAGIGIVPHSIVGGELNWAQPVAPPVHIDHMVHIPHMPGAVADELSFRRTIAPIMKFHHFRDEQGMLKRAANEAVGLVHASTGSSGELGRMAEGLARPACLIDTDDMTLQEALDIFKAAVIQAFLGDTDSMKKAGRLLTSAFVFFHSQKFPIAAAIVSELASDVWKDLENEDFEALNHFTIARSHAAAAWKTSLDRYAENGARPFRFARAFMNAWHDPSGESLDSVLTASVDERLERGDRPGAGRDLLRQAYFTVSRGALTTPWRRVHEQMRMGISHLMTGGMDGIDMELARNLIFSANIHANADAPEGKADVLK